MNSNAMAAFILAIGIVVFGFLSNGRYSIQRMNDAQVMRLDRWTGQLAVCGDVEPLGASCLALSEWSAEAPKDKNSN